MKLKTIAAVFVLFSITTLGMLYLDEGLLVIMAVGFSLSGMALAISILRRSYYYVGILLGFHVAMAAFTSWVFINRDLVVLEKAFVFSTFTDANLQWAIVTLVSVSLVVFLSFLLLSHGVKKYQRASLVSMAYEIVGRLDRLPLALFQFALTSSFLFGILLFLTNASVLDVAYPLNQETFRMPLEGLKIPTILATSALAIAYARSLQRGGGFAIWLLIAKANFLVVLILTLMLTGGRGFHTFLWLGFGVFELLLWYRRRGSLAWGVLYVALAWFSYQSWPYMRVALSQFPMDEVLAEALLIGLGQGGDTGLAVAGVDQIRLGDITMISASMFHLLYAIQLIQDGISQDGSTFINLIPQSLPSWLEGVFGERPLGDAILLKDYYYSGGGFLLVASAYWNGGLWVALLFTAVLTAIFVGFDRYLMRMDVGVLYRAVYWLWLPVMIVQMGYGLQGTARVVELLAVVILVDRFLRRRARARGNLFSMRDASQTPPERNTRNMGL